VTGQRSNQLNYVPTPLRKALLDKAFAGFAGSAQNAAHKMRSRRNRSKPLQVSVRLSKLILTQGIANERAWALICGAKMSTLASTIGIAARQLAATFGHSQTRSLPSATESLNSQHGVRHATPPDIDRCHVIRNGPDAIFDLESFQKPVADRADLPSFDTIRRIKR
jgi:hypothetical protein